MKKSLSVCMISKFPPIQGGMAASAYWLAKDFAKDEDLDLTILTNSNVVEREYFVEN